QGSILGALDRGNRQLGGLGTAGRCAAGRTGFEESRDRGQHRSRECRPFHKLTPGDWFHQTSFELETPAPRLERSRNIGQGWRRVKKRTGDGAAGFGTEVARVA